jgi:hypothetical protein
LRWLADRACGEENAQRHRQSNSLSRSIDSNTRHVESKLQERIRRGMTRMLNDVEQGASGAVAAVVASRSLNATAG